MSFIRAKTTGPSKWMIRIWAGMGISTRRKVALVEAPAVLLPLISWHKIQLSTQQTTATTMNLLDYTESLQHLWQTTSLEMMAQRPIWSYRREKFVKQRHLKSKASLHNSNKSLRRPRRSKAFKTWWLSTQTWARSSFVKRLSRHRFASSIIILWNSASQMGLS